MTRPRKLYVKSFGCQMNVYDSHRMADMLAPEGFAETAHIEDADLVILNTCHIREKAADKVYSELGRMRALKAAAAPRPKVRRSSAAHRWSISSWARKTTIACPVCSPGPSARARSSTRNFRSRTSSIF